MADRRRRAAAGLVVALVVALGAPALAQETATERRVVPIERELRPLERRVVAFDGQMVEAAGPQVTVTLDAEVLFELDQATLTLQAVTTLDALAQELNERLSDPAVTIVGHTDALGTDEYNLDLSQRRAAAVRDHLAPLITVPVTFSVEGRGSTEPVADNTRPDGSDDPEGRRRNRRVELTYTAADPAPS
jgi:outer membrane protein OmpA-like peptidoglycan-associated protein